MDGERLPLDNNNSLATTMWSYSRQGQIIVLVPYNNLILLTTDLLLLKLDNVP